MNKISEVFSLVGAWHQINIRSSIMRATFWFGIMVFTSLFGFVACDGWTGDDPASPTPDPPQLTAVNPTANKGANPTLDFVPAKISAFLRWISILY